MILHAQSGQWRPMTAKGRNGSPSSCRFVAPVRALGPRVQGFRASACECKSGAEVGQLEGESGTV